MKPVIRQRSNATLVSATKRVGFDTPMKKVQANNFEATQKWKAMIKKFVEDIPLDKNRRLIRNYIDTFTGLTATDTLEHILIRVFPERTCDRTNAVRVLQKFMEEQIIQDVQDPTSRRFKDDTTLYRIRETSLGRYDLKLPMKIKRSASLDTGKNRANMSFDVASTSLLNPSSNKNNGEPVCLSRSGSFKRMIRHHRPFSFSMNATSSGAPLAVNDEDETPPKIPRVRYATGVNENDSASKSLFYATQLTTLLDGIIKNQKISERERHDKLMHFKECYPDIFNLKFPNNSYVPPPFSMLDRIKSFIGA